LPHQRTKRLAVGEIAGNPVHSRPDRLLAPRQGLVLAAGGEPLIDQRLADEASGAGHR
jgi:hypothetical protein